MTTENVVALPGYSVPTPKGEPVQGVIDILKEMVEQAECGRLRAIGICTVLDDGAPGTTISNQFCGDGHSWDLEVSARRLLDRIREWSDE